MISARYAPAVTLLLALALIPTVRNSYVAARVQDGRSTERIPLTLAGQFGAATQRGASWARTTLAAEDAIERRYGGVTLFVARSFDAKQLYHHPELAVSYGRNYSATGTRQATGRPEITLHWLSGTDAWAIYALAYRDTFVTDAVRFEVRRALTTMVQPREAMTLFFVHGTGPTPPAEGEAVLLAAIDNFGAQQAAASR